MRARKIMVLAAAAILSASLLAGCGDSREEQDTKTKTEDTAKKDKETKKEDTKVINPKKKTEEEKSGESSTDSDKKDTYQGEGSSQGSVENQENAEGSESLENQENGENNGDTSSVMDEFTDENGHYDPSGGRETYETAGYVLSVDGNTMRIDEENTEGRTYQGEGEDRATVYDLGMALVDCPVLIKAGLSVDVEYYVEDGVNYAVHVYSDGDEKEPIG